MVHAVVSKIIIIVGRQRNVDGQLFDFIYITSKCTCPIVQGVGCKCMLCIVIPYSYKPAIRRLEYIMLLNLPIILSGNSF